MDRVEFGSGDDLGELLHVDGLNVHNVWNVSKLRACVRCWDLLKLWSLMFRFHRLMRRSSAEMYVSPSEFTEMELMW